MAKRTPNMINFEKDMAKFMQSIKELTNEPKAHKIMYQSVMRKPAKPIADIMKSKVNVKTGKLRKSIAIRNMRKLPGLFIGPQVRSKGANFAGNWAWVAYGTKERKIDSKRTKPSTRKKMVTRNGRKGIFAKFSNGDIAFVYRTGAMKDDNNYAHKALAESQTALQNTRDAVQKRMSKQYDKILQGKRLKKAL